jgi:hypothetical protein
MTTTATAPFRTAERAVVPRRRDADRLRRILLENVENRRRLLSLETGEEHEARPVVRETDAEIVVEATYHPLGRPATMDYGERVWLKDEAGRVVRQWRRQPDGTPEVCA